METKPYKIVFCAYFVKIFTSNQDQNDQRYILIVEYISQAEMLRFL